MLKDREDLRTDYLNALIGSKNVKEARDKALSQGNIKLEDNDEETRQLKADLNKLITESIPASDKAIETAQGELRTAIKNFQRWVTIADGLSPDDFIECIFNLAFVGDPTDHEGNIAKHGVFTGLTTLGSQITKLALKAANTLPDDEGQPVNRKHLLRQVDTFSGKLSKISEAWAAIQNAKHPSDPEMVELKDRDAYRLLVSQKELENLLDRFSGSTECKGPGRPWKNMWSVFRSEIWCSRTTMPSFKSSWHWKPSGNRFKKNVIP